MRSRTVRQATCSAAGAAAFRDGSKKRALAGDAETAIRAAAMIPNPAYFNMGVSSEVTAVKLPTRQEVPSICSAIERIGFRSRVHHLVDAGAARIVQERRADRGGSGIRDPAAQPPWSNRMARLAAPATTDFRNRTLFDVTELARSDGTAIDAS